MMYDPYRHEREQAEWLCYWLYLALLVAVAWGVLGRLLG